MKNKTTATWLALFGGPWGLHRFYVHGWTDRLGWLLPIPTLVGATGILRARNLGVDDQISWLLIPLIGFTIAGCALCAIVYGLCDTQKWNHRFNPAQSSDTPAGQTTWVTIVGVVLALLIGATALMASLAFSFQHFFEYQIEEARLISQPTVLKKPAD